MKACVGVDVYIHILLISALAGGEGGEWSASRPDRLTPRERVPRTHWIGGCVDPQSRSGRRGERKILDRPGTRTPIPLSSSP
jgi:hypothetical protein